MCTTISISWISYIILYYICTWVVYTLNIVIIIKSRAHGTNFSFKYFVVISQYSTNQYNDNVLWNVFLKWSVGINKCQIIFVGRFLRGSNFFLSDSFQMFSFFFVLPLSSSKVFLVFCHWFLTGRFFVLLLWWNFLIFFIYS